MVVNTASLTALMTFKTLASLAHTTAKAGIIAMTRSWQWKAAIMGFAPIRFRRG